MQRLVSGALLTLLTATAMANGSANGVWKTESNETGGYLEVTMEPCASNAQHTCGTISQAHDGEAVDDGYEHLGKLMVKDMEPDGDNHFSGGTIWDPEADKTYKSKMTVNGDELEVDGCIAFLCSGQSWTRVE